MEYQIINKIIIADKIMDKDKFFSIGYNHEMNIYIMAVEVTWIAWYQRYYAITQEDYMLYQTDRATLTTCTGGTYISFSFQSILAYKIKQKTHFSQGLSITSHSTVSGIRPTGLSSDQGHISLIKGISQSR